MLICCSFVCWVWQVFSPHPFDWKSFQEKVSHCCKRQHNVMLEHNDIIQIVMHSCTDFKLHQIANSKQNTSKSQNIKHHQSPKSDSLHLQVVSFFADRWFPFDRKIGDCEPLAHAMALAHFLLASHEPCVPFCLDWTLYTRVTSKYDIYVIICLSI